MAQVNSIPAAGIPGALKATLDKLDPAFVVGGATATDAETQTLITTLRGAFNGTNFGAASDLLADIVVTNGELGYAGTTDARVVLARDAIKVGVASAQVATTDVRNVISGGAGTLDVEAKAIQAGLKVGVDLAQGIVDVKVEVGGAAATVDVMTKAAKDLISVTGGPASITVASGKVSTALGVAAGLGLEADVLNLVAILGGADIGAGLATAIADGGGLGTVTANITALKNSLAVAGVATQIDRMNGVGANVTYAGVSIPGGGNVLGGGGLDNAGAPVVIGNAALPIFVTNATIAEANIRNAMRFRQTVVSNTNGVFGANDAASALAASAFAGPIVTWRDILEVQNDARFQ